MKKVLDIAMLWDVTIVEGSGSGELQDISGSMLIVQDADGHRYELTFGL